MMQALRSIGGGLVASLLSLAYCLSYGALVFSGPLQPFLGQGVAAALITAAVTAPIVALGSSFRSAVAGPDSNTAALLAATMAFLAPTLALMRPDRALALALAVLGAATMLTAVALFLLGWRRAGRVVRYIPYPVVAGFLAATGWLMFSGAVNMASGVRLSWGTLSAFTDWQTVIVLGITVLWSAVLWFLTARWKHPVVLPLALVAATLATHAVLAVLGLPAAVIADWDLMFAVPRGGEPVVPLLTGDYFLIDWHMLLPVAGDIIAVAALAIISILLNSTSIELATGTNADLDRELRVQGLANAASAVAGGFVGHVSVSRTLVNVAAGGVSRLSGVVVGLTALAVLIGGAQVVSYVPRFVLSGLLLHLGARLIWEWGVLSYRGLPPREWIVVVAIVLITSNFGFLEALLFGMLAGCVIFAVDVSRIRVIRHHYGLDERPSSIVRSSEQSAYLLHHGGQVQVLELSGYLFFGSAYSLLERVNLLVAEYRLKTIIFDFSAVTGIDSSAGASFAKIRELLRKAGVRQVMAAMSPAAAEILSTSSGLDDEVVRHDQLDGALEAAEELVLVAHDAAGGKRRTMIDWLQDVIGMRAVAEELFGRMTPAPRSADGYLCRQGDPTDSLIFIERGPVSVILERQEQSDLRVRVFGDHTLVGEVGFFLEAPRSASLRAPDDAVAWALDRPAFDDFMQRRPEQALALAIHVIRLQSERLTFANRQIASLQR
jgi:sulfate permease, SulP family